MINPVPSPPARGEENLSQGDALRVLRVQAELSECYSRLAGIDRAVTVFGSARTLPETKEYRLAVDAGALLAKAGYAVITGGGPGVMEAANKGAWSEDGRSIGVGIELPMEQQLNAYLTTKLVCRYFFTRKVMFVNYAKAFIVMPGGFGSLDELFEVLTLVQTRKLEKRPIVLVGEKFWTGLISWINEQLLAGEKVSPGDPDLLHLVDTAEQAVKLVEELVNKRVAS